jgi:S1-C subfamily serine protease
MLQRISITVLCLLVLAVDAVSAAGPLDEATFNSVWNLTHNGVVKVGTRGGSGSGWIYKREGDTLTILTNWHVADNWVRGLRIYDPLIGPEEPECEPSNILHPLSSAVSYTVCQEPEWMTAYFIAADDERDLAILRVYHAPQGLKALELEDYPPRMGQYVLTIGYPYGWWKSMSLGIVTGLDRDMERFNFQQFGMVETDAVIVPGNSGGVAMSSDGKVIGMPTIAHKTEKIGFAVSAKSIREFLDEYEAGTLPDDKPEPLPDILEIIGSGDGLGSGVVSLPWRE